MHIPQLVFFYHYHVLQSNLQRNFRAIDMTTWYLILILILNPIWLKLINLMINDGEKIWPNFT